VAKRANLAFDDTRFWTRQRLRVIPELRKKFNEKYTSAHYAALRALVDQRGSTSVQFRLAETPIFVPRELLENMAAEGRDLASRLLDDTDYLGAARKAIPAGFCVAGQTAHPNFLTADFALVRETNGDLSPRLVEIQAFPSIFALQAVLCSAHREVFALPENLGCFLNGLNESSYWELFATTVIGKHDPENVVLTEVDPLHQKTLPDFEITASRLGIVFVDIAALEPVGDVLHYRNRQGRLVPVRRIYNRAIADELIGRDIRLPFDLTRPWNVEWAGHPNWYFLISKFSVPWLCRQAMRSPVVPPAVFLGDFLAGAGREKLAVSGVTLPDVTGPGTVYSNLLLKPLFSFAGKGIQFGPTQAQLESIPADLRADYLLQQRMRFEPTIETPFGLTQAEFRILYLWPDEGRLTPALSLVRLGRGKMMGVDHNKNQEWVGASAAFFPQA
jgi:hypothetical protein